MKITKSQLKQIIKEELEAALKEGGAFATEEEIQDIVDKANEKAAELGYEIKSFEEFEEAAGLAWHGGKLKSEYEPSRHEVREAWKKHPGNMRTHDLRTGIRYR